MSHVRRAYAIRRPVENAYLVRERDRRRLRDLLGVAAIVAVLGGGLLAYTWIHTEILRSGYRANVLERELHELREEVRRLRLEASYLEHPRRIDERARAELGMRPPTLEEMIFWEELGR